MFCEMKCFFANHKCMSKFIFVCVALMLLIIGSYEAKIVLTNTRFQTNDVCNLWLFIYVTFFIDIATSIITLIYSSGLKICDDQSYSLVKMMYFFEFVITVAAAIYVKMMDPSCYKFWEDEVPEFLSFVQFHGSMIWGFLCAGIVYLLKTIIMCRYPDLFTNDEQLLDHVI